MFGFDLIVGAGGWYCGGMTDGDSQSDVEALAAYLAGRDVACPGCGYNLRGLKAGRCPECDEGLELELRRPELRWGPFIAGLIGLGGTFGLFVMSLAARIVYGILWGQWFDWVGLGIVLVSIPALGAILYFWISDRDRLARRPLVWQIKAAVIAWLISLGFVWIPQMIWWLIV